MVRFRAVALRLESDDFPGWIEFSVYDAAGKGHRFIEKIPIATELIFLADSPYPIEFWIDVDKVSTTENGFVVDMPWGIESTEGLTTLTLLPSDVQIQK